MRKYATLTIILMIIFIVIFIGTWIMKDIKNRVGINPPPFSGEKEDMISAIFGESEDVMFIAPDWITLNPGDIQVMNIYVRNTGDEKAKFTLELEFKDQAGNEVESISWITKGLNSKELAPEEIWAQKISINPTKSVTPGEYLGKVKCMGTACNGKSAGFTISIKG